MIEEELSAVGPHAPLAGVLNLPSPADEIADTTPVILIIPGSGPTDRDGNSPLGISANPYRLLAGSLVARGLPVVRIDKRGLFGSKSAVDDPNDVTIDAYGDDVLRWIEAIQDRLPRRDGGPRRVIPLGHSEGGLIVLAVAPRIRDLCGLILVATPGRPLAALLMDQLRANPANAAILPEAETVIAGLQRGARCPAQDLHPALAALFPDQLQPFWVDLFSYDPGSLIADVAAPVLILQGGRDLQVSPEDARILSQHARHPVLSLIPQMNHVLKSVADPDRQANLQTYGDPDLPLAPGVAETILDFVAGLTGG